MNCPDCNIGMFNAVKYFSSNRLQELKFCPRCKHEILGKIVEGYLEVEDLYTIEIIFNSTGAEVSKIAKTRKLDRSLSISELKNLLLSRKKIRLGTYSYDEALHIHRKAIALQLNAEIITIPQTDSYFIMG